MTLTLKMAYNSIPARSRSAARTIAHHHAVVLRMRRIASARHIRLPEVIVDAEQLMPRVERAVFTWGLVNPVLALPQLYGIFAYKHVEGFSAITISAALAMSALWAAYGILGRQTVVWATSLIWVVLNAVTLAGVLLFKA